MRKRSKLGRFISNNEFNNDEEEYGKSIQENFLFKHVINFKFFKIIIIIIFFNFPKSLDFIFVKKNRFYGLALNIKDFYEESFSMYICENNINGTYDEKMYNFKNIDL